MRRTRFVFSLAIMMAVPLLQGADLRLTCDSGHRVFIDDAPTGECAGHDTGIVVEDLEPGEHVVRIEDAAGSSRQYTIEIGQTSTQLRVAQAAATPDAGRLDIAAQPPRCWVEIADHRLEMTGPGLTILGLPAGDHTLWLQQLGTLLEASVTIDAARPVTVTADFLDSVIDVEAEEPKDAAAASAPTDPDCFFFWVDILRTSSVKKVGEVSEALEEAGYGLRNQHVVTVKTGEMPLYKLRVGPFSNRLSADRTRFKLKNLDFGGAMVIREPCPPIR
jgi:hypothetical protein